MTDSYSTTWNGPTHGPITGDGGSDNNSHDEKSRQTHDHIWTVRELNILGGFLWLAVIIILIGNFSCFYAVWKNLKKILEHPFFQSNVFCVMLSVADVLLCLLVGIPAAVFFTSTSTSLGNSFYNL